MKRNNIILFMLMLTFCLASCDKYLDRQPDDALTEEKVFAKRATTEQYLYHVYSYVPREWNAGDKQGWLPASDECAFSISRNFKNMTNGSWSPSSIPYEKETGWKPYYRGIREATYFMGKVALCPELRAEEIIQYKAEARFLRAFYYYELMRMYGPVVLIGEEVLDPSNVSFSTPRATWAECVEYVCNEMDSVVKILPPVQDELWYGKPTSGAALAIKSIVLLTNASQLFNPNPSVAPALYGSVKNADGTELFSSTYDVSKWQAAANAAKAVINSGGGYELYKVYDGDGDIDPISSLQGIHTVRWNSELIFARTLNETWWFQHTVPRGTNTYGVFAVTQQQVDAFAMANGRYPLINSDNTAFTDPTSGYQEHGFRDFTNPMNKLNAKTRTYQMYCDREPRFYTNVTWNGMGYPYKSARKKVEFAFGSASGNIGSFDYPLTGYLIRKACKNDMDPENSKWDGQLTWPIVRLAEIYLNYVEALNECDPGNGDILVYLNKIRERAGVDNIEDVYPEAIGNQNLMRELIRRERRVELCFESRRYFDTRRWQIAERTDGGAMYGMNIYSADDSEAGDYWKRNVADNRVFEKKHYLFPIAQAEIEKNKAIVQNFGW